MKIKIKHYGIRSIVARIRSQWHIIVSLAIVISTGLAIAWINRNQINPDGVAYIQIAKHYAAFNFKEAINGYWSPLLSWILVPFLWLKVDPLFAFRFINFALSVGLIIGLVYFLNRGRKLSQTEKFTQLFFLTGFGVLLNEWGSAVLTPDFLSGIVLLLVLLAIYRRQANPAWASSAILGAALAGLYFAKYVGFYVSLVLVVFLALKFRKDNLQLKSVAISTGVFLFFSVFWILLISLKYQSFSVTTSTSYNLATIGPSQQQFLQNKTGIHPAHYSDEIFAWDDPSYYKIPKWSITKHPRFYINVVLANLHSLTLYFFELSPLMLVGILALIRSANTPSLALLLSILVISAAYCLVLIEQRYLLIVAVPLISFCSILIKAYPKSRELLGAFAAVCLVSVATLVPVFQYSHQTQLQEGSVKYIASIAKKYVPSYSRVAMPFRHNYTFCFFSNTQCYANYDLSKPSANIPTLISTMRNQGIKYYAEFGAPRRYGLPVVYTATNSSHQCYDFAQDKEIKCPEQSVTVYRLAPSG